MSRIEMTDTTMSIILKMAEGNPGAASVIMKIMKEGNRIDPDSFSGSIGALLDLDSLGVYGSRIWMLYKDVCGENINKTIAMLRAFQMGFVPSHVLAHAIDNHGKGIDLDALIVNVSEALPNFVMD